VVDEHRYDIAETFNEAPQELNVSLDKRTGQERYLNSLDQKGSR